MGRKLPVPIAFIEVKDTLTLAQAASRLEAYEQKQKSDAQSNRLSAEPIAFQLGKVLAGEPEDKEVTIKQKAKAKTAALLIPKADSLPKGSLSERPSQSSKYFLKKSLGQSEKKISAKDPLPKQKSAAWTAEQGRWITERDGFHTVKASANPSAITAFYRAVIEGKHKINRNSVVKIRLLEDIPLQNTVIPKHSFLLGRASMGSQGRIQIKIHSIPKVVLPELFSLSVYDLDYQEGIAYSLAEPVREAIAEGKEQALDDLWHLLPYGGIAGSALDVGRKLSQRLLHKRSLVLADNYPLLLKPQPPAKAGKAKLSLTPLSN